MDEEYTPAGIPPHYENPTFGDGPDFNLNACVGVNSGAVNAFGYQFGFAQAVEVLMHASAAPEFSLSSLNASMPILDVLIYPICFCARHHIELFLKRSIDRGRALLHLTDSKKHRLSCFPEGSENHHDLINLWQVMLDILVATDERFRSPCLELEPYVDDFHDIDPVGQTFRYPFSKQSLMHLEKIPRINLERFSTRYMELCSLMVKFDLYIDEIQLEYETGTFTKELSRKDLETVLGQLPPRDKWGSEAFEAVKQQMVNRFGLSGRGFSRALKVIEANRAFSFRLGKEKIIEALTASTFTRLRQIATGASNVGLSIEECSAILGVIEAGSPLEYPEVFEAVFTMHIADDAGDSTRQTEREPSYLARKCSAQSDRFIRGLTRLGQPTLIGYFQTAFSSNLPTAS